MSTTPRSARGTVVMLVCVILGWPSDDAGAQVMQPDVCAIEAVLGKTVCQWVPKAAGTSASAPVAAKQRVILHAGSALTKTDRRWELTLANLSNFQYDFAPFSNGGFRPSPPRSPAQLPKPPPRLVPACDPMKQSGLLSLALQDGRTLRPWCSAVSINGNGFLTAAHCVDPELFEVVGTSGTPLKCEVAPQYRHVDPQVRRDRCRLGVPGCEMDLAICYGPTPMPDDGFAVWANAAAAEAPHAAPELYVAGLGETFMGNATKASYCPGRMTVERWGSWLPPAGAGDESDEVDRHYSLLRRTRDEQGSALSGDSGGGVYVRRGDALYLVGITTRFNLAAGTTHFLDLTGVTAQQLFELFVESGTVPTAIPSK